MKEKEKLVLYHGPSMHIKQSTAERGMLHCSIMDCLRWECYDQNSAISLCLREMKIIVSISTESISLLLSPQDREIFQYPWGSVQWLTIEIGNRQVLKKGSWGGKNWNRIWTRSKKEADPHSVIRPFTPIPKPPSPPGSQAWHRYISWTL